MLKKVRIEPTDIYPEITLDKSSGIFEIKGVSIPENGKEFYQPVLDFLSEYIERPNFVTRFVFNLHFFNISSSKMILFILYKLKELRAAGKTVEVIWCYHEDDEEIFEAGKDFEQMVNIPFVFKLIPGNQL